MTTAVDLDSNMTAANAPAPSRFPDDFRFSVSHLKDSEFKTDGLRPFFEYRDLGVKAATNGRAVAHVIRARPGVPAKSEWHRHEVEFQMVYVLKGWIEFEYEGLGKMRMEAGTCFHQPNGIRHIEHGHSDDVEMIEIVLPGDFRTFERD